MVKEATISKAREIKEGSPLVCNTVQVTSINWRIFMLTYNIIINLYLINYQNNHPHLKSLFSKTPLIVIDNLFKI